ncbi:MAG: EAL domain-containing protein [Phycisphaerales bacterium]
MTEKPYKLPGAYSTFLTRWGIVGVVAVVSVSVVLLLSYLSWRGQTHEHHRRFQQRVDGMAGVINDRLKHFEVAMELGRGLLAASQTVNRDEWRAFTRTGRLFEQVPGAFGFAYVQRVPKSGLESFLKKTRADGSPDFHVFDTDLYESVPYDDYCVIKYIEPVERNANAIGLNVASIPASYNTMWRSVEEDRMAISYRLNLQQTGASQAGIVLYLPIYPGDTDVSTPAARRDAVTGWIAMPLAMTDFVTDIWASHWSDIDVVLCEVSPTVPERALFITPEAGGDVGYVLNAPEHARYRSVIPLGGWSWVLYARDPEPAAALFSIPVLKVFSACSAIGLLLVLLTWSLTRTRDHARSLADQLTVSLRRSEQRYALAVDGSHEGLWDWDLTTGKVHYATRWKELLGLKEDEVGDQPEEWFGRIVFSCLTRFHTCLTQHIEGETDRFDIELEMLHADGSTRWMLCRATALRGDDGKAVRIAGSMADITDLKHAQNELVAIAHHDRLTGLANRALFTDRLQQAINYSKHKPAFRFAVLFLDFDRFKNINDSMGHGVGDRLLVGMAERILRTVRECDTVARFGGDEFVILLDGVGGVAEAQEISGRLLAALSQPFSFEACEVISTVSIGVVGSEFGYTHAGDMIRDADAAMYQAKAGGKARYCLFDVQMHTQAVRRLKLEQDLRSCDFGKQFLVYYQPIISLDSGDVDGFEALVRWDHPEYGLVSPDEFISIAEESGLIVELGKWVLVESCRQMARWRSRFTDASGISISVNVSKRQLLHADLIPAIQDVLEETGLPAQALKLEVTESTVMENHRSNVTVMKRIRDLGVHLAMDDFGTGHSSLSCLHQFPIDQLKIDRSFIVNMQEHREFAAVMDAIVTLAHFLHLDVVAEGIENADQLAMLQAMDCKFGQGYFFAKPMTAQDATEFLANRGNASSGASNAA